VQLLTLFKIGYERLETQRQLLRHLRDTPFHDGFEVKLVEFDLAYFEQHVSGHVAIAAFRDRRILLQDRDLLAWVGVVFAVASSS